MLGLKPKTVHPPAQSIHPLSFACSIQTPDGQSPTPVHYAMPVPFKPRMFNQLAQSIHPLRYAGSIQPRTVHSPTQSLLPLRYADSIETTDGPSTTPVNTPTTLYRFHSNPGRSIPQSSQYTHYAMLFPFKPRTFHPPAPSLHQLRYVGSIQQLLQAC